MSYTIGKMLEQIQQQIQDQTTLTEIILQYITGTPQQQQEIKQMLEQTREVKEEEITENDLTTDLADLQRDT